MTDIREAAASDLPDVLSIHELAFGHDMEATLVRAILADPTAQPVLSLLAEDDGRALGHVLFSNVRLIEPQSDCRAAILAPLAVVPRAQGTGVGGKLIKAGLARLRANGVDLVFVLGDPAYYSRFGFVAAGRQGLIAPYPIPEGHAEAWMVQALRESLQGAVEGSAACCDALMHPQLWLE